MRCSGWSSLAISVCSALVLAGSASAHVVATPAFLPTGSSESVTFSGPNERDAPMTAFALTVPEGVEIEHAHEVAGWEEAVDGSTATWTGGPLGPNVEQGFGATLRADAEPGIVELQAEQRYADGSVVSWPVSLTVTPATDSPSQNLALAGVVGLIGLLLVVAVAMLAWRRRSTRSDSRDPA
jgi:uncharacterized protein YcnI